MVWFITKFPLKIHSTKIVCCIVIDLRCIETFSTYIFQIVYNYNQMHIHGKVKLFDDLLSCGVETTREHGDAHHTQQEAAERPEWQSIHADSECATALLEFLSTTLAFTSYTCN